MDAARWQRIDEVFAAALEQPVADRNAFLERVCGSDTELRREVESLLAHHGDHLVLGGGAPEAAHVLVATQRRSLVGRRLGPYEILSALGIGGMGEVYLARRSDGTFEQEVAIKLVRAGMTDDPLLRRFVAERQILAGLVHPYIARLYDGGTTEDGIPYLVMEHVDGEGLLTACDRRRLSIADRLRMFEKICAAVQYAHQRLVVHRDLKPSNILVTADGTPKLLDFGIAKLLRPEDTRGGTSAAAEPGELTELGVRPFTPEYASPEQVLGQPVTTASDVYSLGVILYELLTGRRPYAVASRQPHELARVICEITPQRPSTAVGRPSAAREATATSVDGVQGCSVEAISLARDTTPRRLRRALAGDLDNIVMTALRKEPERRYPSADKLADDVRRHLAGLPVSARADTFSYRAGKLLLRYRWTAAATALVLLTMASLVAFYTARLTRERDRARREAAKAQRVSAFLGSLFELSDLDRTKGVKLSLRDVVDRGASSLPRELAAEPDVAATMMELIGDVYQQLDLRREARPLLARALEVRRRLYGAEDQRVAQTEVELAVTIHELGEPQHAAALLRHAVIVLERRPAARRQLAGALTVLAEVDKALDDYAGALASLDRAVAVLERIGPSADVSLAAALTSKGHLLLSTNDPARARPLFERAYVLRRQRLGEASPSAAASLLDLAAADREMGRVQESIAVAQRVLAIGERSYGPHHSLAAYAAGELAKSWAAQGDAGRARSLFRRAIADFTALTGPDSHPTLLYRGAYGQLLVATGEPRAGLAELEATLAGYERSLGPQHPRVAGVLLQVGRARLRLGDDRGAEQAFRRALDIDRRQPYLDRQQLGETLTDLGDLLCARGERSAGLPVLREATTVLRHVGVSAPLVTAERRLQSCTG